MSNNVKRLMHEEKPSLISVIVTVKNYENLIKNCIESIIDQTYQRLEIILVVDSTLDSSLEICKKYENMDARIKVFNDNFLDNTNMKSFALTKAHGDYITFINGTDFISLNYIEYMLKILKKYDANISECEFLSIPEMKFNMDTFEVPKQEEEKEEILSSLKAIERIFDENEKVSLKEKVLWNKLYKKDVLRNIEFPNDSNYEDDFVTYKLFNNAKKIISSNQILYANIKKATYTLKSNYNLSRLNVMDAYENYLSFFKNINSNILLKKACTKYLKIILSLRKEISSVDVIVENKDEILDKLDNKFLSIYEYLHSLENNNSSLENKELYEEYYKKYKFYLK